jgi:hypothetical protein
MAGVSFSLPLKPATQRLMWGGVLLYKTNFLFKTKPILACPLHCRASAAEILEVVENEPIFELTWIGLLSEITLCAALALFSTV